MKSLVYVCALDTSDPQAMLYIGDCHLAAGDSEAACVAYQAAVDWAGDQAQWQDEKQTRPGHTGQPQGWRVVTMADGIRADSTAASQSANKVPLDGTENAKEVVGRGFADANSVSHQGAPIC